MSGVAAKLYAFLTQAGEHPRTTSLAYAVYAYLSARTMYPPRSKGRIFLSYRSAKSVAWRRLNVVGVSSPFFFPLEVISRTICDEFHSVVKTGRPRPLSHLSRRWSWVDLPLPSMPSTTMSFPVIWNFFGDPDFGRCISSSLLHGLDFRCQSL